MTGHQKKLWLGLIVLALLTPLGVILPARFKAGGAWGEWGPAELKKLIGYMPEGFKKLADLWKAPVPDYNFGGEQSSMTSQIISYIASGIIGILAVAIVIYVISRLIVKNEK
ncbi:MAG: PDGLE domain-containing protein [Dissulfurispiraceae bacterium]